MRKILIIVICIFLCTTLSGCYGATEVDDYTYVIILGIDKGSQEKLKITIQYPTIKDGQSGDSSSTESSQSSAGYSITSIEAPSILGGLNMLNTVIPRFISLKHLKAIIISEDLAREGIVNFLGFGMYKEVRRPLPIYIAQSGSENFIRENKPTIGTNIAKTADFINNGGYRTGFYEGYITIDFYRYAKSPYAQATAPLMGLTNKSGVISGDPTHIIHEKAGDNIINGDTQRSVMGTAVFRGDKMVGELDGDETRVLLMVLDEFRSANMDVPDPKDPNSLINYDVRMSKKTKITSKIENGIPYINVNLNIAANINAIRSNINYLDPSLLPLAQNALKEYIQELLDELINKCQREYKSDIFNFGSFIGTHFLTIQEWEKYDWLDKFPDAKISTQVHVNIDSPGLLNKFSPAKEGD